MKAAQIKVGGHYATRISGNFVTVRVDTIRTITDYKRSDRTVYDITNLTTGRRTTFRSAQKFRSEVKSPIQKHLDSPLTRKLVREDKERADPTTTTPTPPSAMPPSTSEPAPTADATPAFGTADAPAGEGEHSRPFALGNEAPTESSPAATPTLGGSGLAARIASHATTARQLTEEQQEIVRSAPTTQVLVIEAGAGCGKTSTLVELAKATPGTGQYTAFNTSLVAESKAKFPSRVPCNTIHSLAFRVEGIKHKHRLGGRRVTGSEVAAMLGLRDLTVEGPDGKPKVLNAGLLASQVTRGLRNFTQSADDEVMVGHLPRLQGLDAEGRRTSSDAVKAYILPYAQKMWADKCDPAGLMPFVHDDYVKMFQMGDARIAGDYLLIDEAQDLSPVMLSIGEKNVKRGMRLIVVGDSAQSIYQWRGSINALGAFPDAPRLMLSQCQPTGTMVRVPFEQSRTGLLTGGRTKTEWRDVPIESIKKGDYVVSWSQRDGVVKRGHEVTDVTTRDFDGDLVVVQVGEHKSRYAPNHECIVVLGDCLDDGDHIVYMMRRGDQYRIGRCPWRYGNGIGPIRRSVTQTADAMWVLSVHTTESEASLAEALNQLQFSIPGQTWVDGHHYKMCLDTFWSFVGDNTTEAKKCLDYHSLLIDHPLWEKSESTNFGAKGSQRGGWTTRIVTAAANLRSGMKMLAPGSKGETNGSEKGFIPWSTWTGAVVSREHYTGTIYSLSVDVDHTYIADGIVTHNSFRFGQVIAEVANTVLSNLQERSRLVMRGFEKIDSRLDRLDRPDAILCRTNAGAITHLIDGIQHGRKPHLIGGGDDVAAFVRAAGDLQQSKTTNHPELCCFANWRDVQAYAKTDEGEDLRLMVKIIDTFKVGPLLAALGGMPEEKDADLVISTAHKSKGREWKTVKLAGDFKPLDRMGDEEVRLLYVAATRAQHTLDVETCPPFCGGPKRADDGWNGEGGELRTVNIDRARRLSRETPTVIQPAVIESKDAVDCQKCDPVGGVGLCQKPTNCAGEKKVNDNTWTKGKYGGWVVRGKPGQSGEVEVTRKNGTTSRETIKRTVWSDAEVALYEVEAV